MADKSNWYDFLIPSQDTREKIEETLEEGQLINRIIGEEGIDGLIIRLREEELLNEGVPEAEVQKRIKEDSLAFILFSLQEEYDSMSQKQCEADPSYMFQLFNIIKELKSQQK